MCNRRYICNWDGVDDSALYIVGPYLLNRDKAILCELVRSKNLWDRYIAIVRNVVVHPSGPDRYDAENTLAPVRSRRSYPQNTGWMLREVGKRNLPALKLFLRVRAHKMPRTTLRYALTLLTRKRALWLRKKAKKNWGETSEDLRPLPETSHRSASAWSVVSFRSRRKSHFPPPVQAQRSASPPLQMRARLFDPPALLRFSAHP